MTCNNIMSSNIGTPGIKNTVNILQSKTINITINCTVARERNINIQIPFIPDEVIVKQICYQTTEAPNIRVCQIASDLIPDQILGIFPSASSITSLDNHFILKKSINGTYNFQVQDIPANGTGMGPLAGVVTVGQVGLILQFILYG